MEIPEAAPAEKGGGSCAGMTFVITGEVHRFRNRDAFKAYVTEQELGGVQLFDPAGKKESAVAALFHVKWIPSLYLIGPDGKVVLGTVDIRKIAKRL